MILGRRRIPINPEKAKADLENNIMSNLRHTKDVVTKYTHKVLRLPPAVYSLDLEPAQKRQFAVKYQRVAYRLH